MGVGAHVTCWGTILGRWVSMDRQYNHDQGGPESILLINPAAFPFLTKLFQP